ncbi:MAG: hypothetical protein HOV68_32880, partial [Streptomycetaceae bacterium]|nr:hypothetical protein [Streptomycetaceae bacterium]
MSNETRTHPGDALVRAGGIVFLVGAVATVATVVPLLLGLDRLPTAAYLVSMLMAVGFLLAGGGLLRNIAAQRRQARAAAAAEAVAP